MARRERKNTITTERKNTFFYSGKDIAQHGIGILVSDKIMKCVKTFLPVSDRVILIKLRGQPFEVNIITYAPTAGSLDEELEKFYSDIDKARKHIKSDDINIFMGDLNAKVDNEEVDAVIGSYALGDRNDRGSRFIQFCQENKLFVCNTWFKLPKRRLYTWKSPQDREGNVLRNQIDFVTINTRFRNSVLSAKAYPGCDINSDHNSVVITIRVRLKKVAKTRGKEKIAGSKATEKQKIQYQEKVDTKLAGMKIAGGNLKDENIESTWIDFKNILIESEQEAIGKEDRRKTKDWMTEDILKLMDARRELKNKNEQAYGDINRTIEDKIRKAKEQWLNAQWREIEEL